MNKSHPFGLPIWKPALYKKSRSVVRRANSALHSAPTTTPELFLYPGNILWAIVFGWWLSLVMLLLSLILLIVPPDGYKYASVLRGLANYLFWPFGKYVQRLVDIEPESLFNYDNRQLSEDSQGDSDMDEDLGLISGRRHKRKNRFETFKQNTHELISLGPGGWAFYLLFYTVLGKHAVITICLANVCFYQKYLLCNFIKFSAPLQLFVSAICWGCVITIPMAKLTYVLTRHLRKHPLSLRFKSSGSTLMPSSSSFHKRTVILLCTYQAIGLQYYKYTYDGINIIFINLLPVAFFVIFDEYVLHERFPDAWFTTASFVFMLGLGSVIPLSYFIGMAVSSISAQSSMGLGAVINATFGSIIEIILYSVALMRGKSALVEGSLIGSFLAGVLLMPGCSMLSGAVKRKEQKFNAKSAGMCCVVWCGVSTILC
jgi:Ca2+:H+ antiporter